MENEKTTLQKIADVIKSAFSNTAPAEENFTEQTEPTNESKAEAAAITVDAAVALPDGVYTVEADGSTFTVTAGKISEVKPAEEKTEDVPAEEKTEDVPFSAEQKFSAQLNEYEIKFSALENKITKLETVIKAIGDLPGAPAIVRTEAIAEVKPKADLSMYFTSDKDYKDFVLRHTK